MASNKRNILFITTDQMRYDALGCNGGRVAKTPTIDSLAYRGINYRRAHNQNVGCMPARATMLTGQHVASHGVWMNGVSLPEDQPTIAHHLQNHGYQTGLLGKAHFEPWLGSPQDFFENRMASQAHTGPHRGFDHMQLANHFFEGHSHYDLWMDQHPSAKRQFYPMVTKQGQNTASKGATGAVQAWPMDVPTELYHTNWVAQRTMDWLSNIDLEQPFFCWMSFPDPHHPWDIPKNELHRVNWRDVPLPDLYSEDPAQLRAWLAQKPKHWLGYFEGDLWTNLESPKDFVPAKMTPDQVREINALTHIENELIDDACRQVFERLTHLGQLDNTDIVFTTDHGELQGDFGLMFKGPYHVDALMRVPLIWQPARSTGFQSTTQIHEPVGHLDLASTFCTIANVPVPEYCEGLPLPQSSAEAAQQQRQRVVTEWQSEHGPVNLQLSSVYDKSGWLCTRYDQGHLYQGNEGELYNMNVDPGQRVNLWNDGVHTEQQQRLLQDLAQALPEPRTPRLPRLAPV